LNTVFRYQNTSVPFEKLPRNLICEFVGPAQWREPSLSTSILKPSGKRGHSPSSELLHLPQGAPAAPQPQALEPSQGREIWASQTQPVPSQRVHFKVKQSFRRWKVEQRDHQNRSCHRSRE
jgi:hypothetical protein